LTATEKKLHPGDTLNETLHFQNSSNEYFDPTSITVTIKDPNNTTVATLTEADLTQSETGKWILAYDLPADAEPGRWSYTVKAVYGDTTNSETFTFSINPMPYGSLTAVRDLCGVASDNYDSSLQNCMDLATAEINDIIDEVTTVPLSTVPDVIASATNLLAAGTYLQRNSPEEREHPFTTRAYNMIKGYVKRNRRPPLIVANDPIVTN